MTTSAPISIHRRVIGDSQRAVDVVGLPDGLSAEEVLTCFENGAVWLQSSGKPRRLYDPMQKLQRHQQLYLHCNDSTLAPCPYHPELVRDYERFSIWYKPAGMLSQGSKWGDHWTLQRWIHLHHWPDRVSLITHRIDRFTRGLMIVAHEELINRQFHRLFEQRRIGKTYRAVVNGIVEVGKQWEVDSAIERKTAISRIRVLDTDPDHGRSLLEIEPLTGRKHQIRIHLSTAGLPIVNDRQYGSGPFAGDIALQACALVFKNPLNGERLSIRVDDAKLLTLKNCDQKG